jgi:predicted DNA binding CopG/RHH family protein
MTRPKHRGFDAPFLDEEERALIEPIERAGLKPDKSQAEALAEWRSVVKNTLRKKAITVRVQERDIAKLKARAMQKGMPYQTLIASILHQYAEGDLKETV